MNAQLRVRLPTLEGLHANSAVDWAQLHKGEVLAHGCATLAALGLRHRRAAVHACLDPSDLILLELQLPPLSGRRLQLALQGEVEAMLLDDLQDVALAHGAQAADGTVPVAWLGQQAVLQAQQLLTSCGLQLQALHPTPLLLPWQDGQATLQVSGEHLLVRSGRDRGFVQWYGGRDACAVMQALAVRLRQAGVQAVQWIGSVPPAWPDSLPATAVMKERQACGPLPGWSLP
ncbi:type II secretion system protein GspL, partial [Stenotrophomonas muris]|uniref:type II secretion system protein GspL n=1 Tax=Stenotrophomonas muris TaxID=2963283 RepID=UPI00383A9580